MKEKHKPECARRKRIRKDLSNQHTKQQFTEEQKEASGTDFNDDVSHTSSTSLLSSSSDSDSNTSEISSALETLVPLSVESLIVKTSLAIHTLFQIHPDTTLRAILRSIFALVRVYTTYSLQTNTLLRSLISGKDNKSMLLPDVPQVKHIIKLFTSLLHVKQPVETETSPQDLIDDPLATACVQHLCSATFMERFSKKGLSDFFSLITSFFN